MKNLIFALLLIALSPAAFAQTAKPPVKKPTTSVKPKPSVTVPLLKNAVDSFSYALGLSMAGFYKEQGIQNINTSLVTRALNDSKAGKALLDEAAINSTIVGYMQKSKSDKAAPFKKKGQDFLDSNKTKPGVVTLPSGLQYLILKEGTGPKPGPQDKVKVHYHGTLTDGKVFDSSMERGEPIELTVSGVIPGWTEALQLMPVGSKWKLFIPSDLAYGDNGAGADIQPGAALIFDVDLIEIIK